MSRPLQANLKIRGSSGQEEIRCGGCSYLYGSAKEDWRKNANRRLLPPTDAGPYREELIGHFSLQQYSCPSCGVLLETEIVEAARAPT
jgi:acetone carboxylase gamma subunit